MSCSIAISGIYPRQLWITEHSFKKKPCAVTLLLPICCSVAILSKTWALALIKLKICMTPMIQ